MIIFNSECRINSTRLILSLSNSWRDYYKAFRAWEAEDISIIEDDLIDAERKNKVGIVITT
jgi:hypothetical protein